MSVRNLHKLFNPRTVALIGAGPWPGSVGASVLHNLRRSGFAGEMMLVNPHHRAIDGLPVPPDIASRGTQAPKCRKGAAKTRRLPPEPPTACGPNPSQNL
jgi:hypothetical protein